MANEEQLSILKQGLQEWDKWRLENIEIKNGYSTGKYKVTADLSEANLSGLDLSGVDFHGANLRETDLSGAKLEHADFIEADLTNAKLNNAKLFDAEFYGANLIGTELKKAGLLRTNFVYANLGEANLEQAVLHTTFFVSANLYKTKYLESCLHEAPSIIDHNTIAISRILPAIFLRGCGLSDADIEYAKLSNPELSNEEINKILYKIYDLRASQALQISPLFISYSHGDSTFVDKLESQLNKMGVRFWRDIHDAKAGRLEKQIDRAMHLNPTVLLILSDHSLKSDWVEHEVRTARELEKEMGRDVLCPVALDDSWKNSPWPKRVMEQVMEYNILDFSAWEDDRKFDGMFRKLIDGLELFYKG